MAKKPTKKLDPDDLPTPPAGVSAIVDEAMTAEVPTQPMRIGSANVIVLPPPDQICATCGHVTADNACLVCGTRIGGDA